MTSEEYTEKQKRIALWKFERAFAECDSPNAITRAQILELIQPLKEKLRVRMMKEYFEEFGEVYQGDVLEDVVLDLESHRALQKLAGYDLPS